MNSIKNIITSVAIRLGLPLVLCLLLLTEVKAVPVYPHPVRIQQPDGTFITIKGHGDEFFSFTTTTDGYTIIRSEKGFYHYALKDGGDVVASNIVAHDLEERSESEKLFLKASAVSTEEMTAIGINSKMSPMMRKAKAMQAEGPKRSLAQLKNFKGLVILVNFNDRKFRMGNEKTKTIYEGMMNERNFKGYDDALYGFEECTGSVRDYFYDNSYGKFDPTFDVIGPIDINLSQYYPEKANNTWDVTTMVLRTANKYVDYSKYDSNNDGVVDMIYIVYAGYSSNYDGNDSRLIWPHASDLTGYGINHDGMEIGRFACSAEIYGWEKDNDNQLAGIGTICHEFSHVLGYNDHYDTVSSSCESPEEWDVMDGGAYLGECGRTPAGFNAYEKFTGGFITPTLLTKSDSGTSLNLPPLNTETVSTTYRIDTPQDKEYFLIENRQNTKWDACLPGHGMLVWRVDSTNTRKWEDNQVNTSSHTLFQLVRANGYKGLYETSDEDAFPGACNITEISNGTSPANLLSWAKKKSPVAIEDIKENADGTITFTAVDPDIRVVPAGAIFYESFDESMGKGGNDGNFGNGIATDVLVMDNEGWSSTYCYGGYKCARFGSDKMRGDVTTPEFELEEGKNYTLKFKLAAYDSDPGSVTLSVSSGNAQMTTADSQTPATKLKLNGGKNEWKDITVFLTGSGKQKLRLQGTTMLSLRFLLDEFMVIDDEVATGIENISRPSASDNNCRYNIAGQKVNDSYKGIVIYKGKKTIR